MYKVRVLQEIDDRLDAEYYNPAALSTLKKMETKGTVTTLGTWLMKAIELFTTVQILFTD